MQLEEVGVNRNLNRLHHHSTTTDAHYIPDCLLKPKATIATPLASFTMAGKVETSL